MALASGTRLGAYEITHVLGAGGMGEVYRARDSKLGRSVAIKIILEQLGMDGDRVARFEREAKVLASINHPNIAALYGMEEAGGQHFLVMELVEGETLAERIRRGPLPVEDAIRIGLQIVEALEAAHEKGIIHRDLKPANIKITPEEKVKVLDFGLAKAVEAEGSGNVANSPTLSMMATNAGVILGTAAYMSPEQAKGFAADHRSDVFSFGVVFYEMLTGRQPFQGETAPDILASVLVREPELHKLPPDLNPRVPELIRRCLEKHPKRRWQAIGDLRADLEAIAAMPHVVTVVSPAAPKPLWKRAIPVAAASVVTGALAGTAAWMAKPEPPRQVTRFAMALPAGQGFSGIVRQTIDLSPDGRHVVYAAGSQLYLRAMSSFTAQPIQGTDGLQNVFSPMFSPDGQSIAFFARADRTLKRIALTGGAAVTICPVSEIPFGASWSDQGILFSQPEGVMRVSADGGKPEKLVGVGNDERVQRVQMLPDGKTLLFTVAHAATGADSWSRASVVAHSLETGARKTLVESASDGWYLPTGHLAFVVGGTVHAVAFDLDRLEVRGSQVPIVHGVRRSDLMTSGVAWFSVSREGSLAYVPGPVTVGGGYDLGLVNRQGAATPLNLPPGPYASARISPEGRRLVIASDDGRDAVILIYDMIRSGALQRFTFAGRTRFPMWTSDGTRVVFQSDAEGDPGIFWQAADGTSPVQRLTKAEKGEAHVPESWLPRGDVLLYSVVKGTDHELWMYSVPDKKSAPFGGVRSQVPIDAVFSPDGRWVAYTSGLPESATVYVQPFPATGALYQIVRRGSDQPHHPVWANDGRELIVNARQPTFDAVTLVTQPSFAFVGSPAALPKGANFVTGPPAVRRTFDIAPDGRFVGLITPGDSAAQQIHVVLNWFEELKARVPGR